VSVKIRKGDTVVVISGRHDDKGKRGEVIKVLPDELKVVVQGEARLHVSFVKKAL